jgi:hypothetical protein
MKYYYFYEFKNNQHCICATLANLPLEYCGVKGTADTKEIALKQIDTLNQA